MDRAALDAAKKNSVNTGGFAPKFYRTENGSDYTLATFGLIEDGHWDYKSRTEKNILFSGATLIIATNTESAGTKLTLSLCRTHAKPYLVIDVNKMKVDTAVMEIKDWLKELNMDVLVLNVAGNRESKSPGIYSVTFAILDKLCQSDIIN